MGKQDRKLTKEEKRFKRITDGIAIQLHVSQKRLIRRIQRLKDEDVLSVYEDGSNLLFHGVTLRERAVGASLVSASVDVLEKRYDQIKKLDLTEPFPLRDWMNGVPHGAAS